ncbi:MAG: hypothetical protein AAGB29_11165 [Planctomycetota bacterium]
MASTDAATPNRDNPGLVSGKLVVIASIAVFVLIGVAFWAAGKWFSANPIEADDTLDYANRAEWVVMPATTILLTEPPRYMRGPYGSKIKKELPFSITDETAAQLQRIQNEFDKGPNPADHAAIWSSLDVLGEAGFYTRWIEFSWLTSPDEIDREIHITDAVREAPAVFVLQYVGLDSEPLSQQPIGDIELTFARKADDILDDSLRLIYPDNKTDEFGRVYLPVFDTPLQVSVKPDPPGHEAEYPFSGWLIFPGKVGGPEPIVVRPKSE